MLILVENLHYCQIAGAKPGKKHALNNQYALNSELRLLTRVYGIILQLHVHVGRFNPLKQEVIFLIHDRLSK